MRALSPVSPEASVQGQSPGPHRQKAGWARGGDTQAVPNEGQEGPGGHRRPPAYPPPSALRPEQPHLAVWPWSPVAATPSGRPCQEGRLTSTPTQTPCSGATIMPHITWAPPVPLSPPCAALGLQLVWTEPQGAPRPLHTGRGFRACSHPRKHRRCPRTKGHLTMRVTSSARTV